MLIRFYHKCDTMVFLSTKEVLCYIASDAWMAQSKKQNKPCFFLSSDFIKGMCWLRSDVAPEFRHLRSELCSFSFVWTTWLRLPRILCNCFLSERQKARDGVQKECRYTSRAAAAIMTMAVTCLAGLRGGTAVRTWTATFQEHHVVWTFLVCGQKFFNVN